MSLIIYTIVFEWPGGEIDSFVCEVKRPESDPETIPDNVILGLGLKEFEGSFKHKGCKFIRMRVERVKI